MKLFLASEAKNPVSFPKMEKFVGGFEDKKIAYIPTAANGENPYGAWEKESSSWLLLKTLNVKVIPVVLEEQTTQEVMENLEQADIVWVAGGACGYLMYWMRRHSLEKTLPKILESNKPYIGSSAGSMVVGKSLSVTEWSIGDMEKGAAVIPGMGLVDFEIYPHFREDQFEEIKTLREENQTGMPLYLLKDGEAILIEDDQISFFGEKREI